MFERWHWSFDNVEDLEWDDYVAFSDAIEHINKKEADAIKKAQRK